MGGGFLEEFSKGRRNLWNELVQLVEAESDHSAATACEGFALAGGRVTGFHSGQGLLCAKEVLHVIAGKRLPVVFHAGARSVASHALSIHAGHDDVMGVADCGWAMLFARNPQEAADLALIARRAAELSETPFFVVQDGFLTTHTLATLRLPEPELMRIFAGPPTRRLRSIFDPSHPLMSGPSENQESYMKGRMAQRFFFERVRPALTTAMQDYAEMTGREYGLIRKYRMDDAAYAVVGLGSQMDTAEAAVDFLRSNGMEVGAVTLTSFRPFPQRELVAALGQCECVAVVERTDNPLAESNPLACELKAALATAQMGDEARLLRIPEVYSAVAGLGGHSVEPGDFIAAVQNMRRHGRRFFVLGIKHPEALASAPDAGIQPADAFRLRGHSVGGLGSADTTKLIASLMADLFGFEVQAFESFGRHRLGLPTGYYLTLAREAIRRHSEPAQVDLVVVEDASAFRLGDPLQGLDRNGVLLVLADLDPLRVWTVVPPPLRKRIREQEVRLWGMDRRLPPLALVGALLRLTPFQERAGLSEEQLFDRIESALERFFGEPGVETIAGYMADIRRGWSEVAPVTLPVELVMEPAGGPARRRPAPPFSDVPVEDDLVCSGFCERVVESYLQGRDVILPSDLCAARSLVPPSTASYRSFRDLAPQIPRFQAAACGGCMECVNQCPDAAVIATVVEHERLDDMPEELRVNFAFTPKFYEAFVQQGQTGGLFGLAIDVDRCKGCGECVTVCAPYNALEMVPKESVDLAAYDRMREYIERLPDPPLRFVSQKSPADVMLLSRSLLYSGGVDSCKGCGQSSALRMLLAATGYAYGSGEIGVVAASGCHSLFSGTYPFNPYSIPWTSSLMDNAPADAMGIRARWDQEGQLRRRLWVIGGDAALFEAGFQSLARMLTSGMDIKVLVLDAGRDLRPRDRGIIVMSFPGVFVAQTTAAHTNHFYRSVMEANEHPGPAVVVCYSACPTDHGVAESRGVSQERLAVDSRVFPVFLYDPRSGDTLRQQLDLRGNPAMKKDWFTHPKTEEPIDFLAFARTEGRYAENFNDAGEPDAYLQFLQRERLAHWRRLQEMAGLR